MIVEQWGTVLTFSLFSSPSPPLKTFRPNNLPHCPPDNEHARDQVADAYAEQTPGEEQESSTTFKPFANLEEFLKKKD